MAGRFAEPDVARDDGLEDLLLKELPHVTRDLLAKVRAFVVHREQHAVDIECGIQRAAHAFERGHQIGQTFEREVLAVQWDEDGVGGDQRVEGQQAEARRAVDEDAVEAVAQRLEETAQSELAFGQADQLDLGAGELTVGRDHEEVIERGRQNDRVGVDRLGARQCLVDRPTRTVLSPQTDTAGHVRLRVHVDQQHPLLGQGQGRGEVDGGRGFAHAALLVCDGDDS